MAAPPSVGNTLLLDLDPDAVAGVDGDLVASWPDAVSGNNAVASTTARRPTLKTGANGLNGHRLLRFGGDDAMNTGALTVPGNFTSFVIFRASGAAGMIYEHSADANANPGHWLFGTSGYTALANRGQVRSGKDLAPNWSVDNTWRVATQTSDGTHAGHTLHFNGTAQALTSAVAADPGTATATATLYIGARNDVQFFVTGDYARLLVFSGAMTTADRGKVHSWVQDTYGITVADYEAPTEPPPASPWSLWDGTAESPLSADVRVWDGTTTAPVTWSVHAPADPQPTAATVDSAVVGTSTVA